MKMNMNMGKKTVLSADNLEIRNYMEQVVIDQLEPVLTKLGSCQCENCLYDTLAIALNKLPSKYVVTNKGHLYTKINNLKNQFDVDIIAEIARASAIVSRAPRHEPGAH